MAVRPVRVGLHLPENERVVPWAEIADISRLAEDVGFDSLWVPDHLIYRDAAGRRTGPWESWSILSAVAAVTSRVAIAPLVLCTSFREPGLIAKMAVTVDEISEGRLILGLGSGWNEPEYTAFGFPFESRFGRFKESFTIISTLLREGNIDFSGSYYQLRECEIRPGGPRPGGIPLLIGSRGAQVLRHALPEVAYWNGWPRWWGNQPAGIVPLLAQVDEAIAAAGREPHEIAKTAAVFIRLEGGQLPDNPEAPHFMGDTDGIVELLLAYRRLGIEHIQIVVDPITTSSVERLARVLESLDALGDETA